MKITKKKCQRRAPECAKAILYFFLISKRVNFNGGPARTRTWDQYIMSVLLQRISPEKYNKIFLKLV